MAICKTCLSYYKKNAYNQSDECEDCVDHLPLGLDAEDEVEIEHLVNPQGRTLPVFIE